MWNRPAVPATDPLWPHGNRPPCRNGDGVPVYLAGLCGPCYAADSPAPVAPPTISWRIRPGESVAHAYSTAAGWMRSVCRAERWTVALDPAPDDLERCTSCAILVDGAPGEVTEAFGG